MAYFSSDYIEFFKALSLNNNRAWFQEQSKRYEKQVKQPFEEFIIDLISEVKKFDPYIQSNPKDCILKIYRDTRFSKDKSPFNSYHTAFISSAGKKDKTVPGLFLRFSGESIGVMGGCFGPDLTQITKIRKHIAANHSVFRSLINHTDFTKTFGKLCGESVKKVSPELKELAEIEPLILNKQWYFVTERKTDLLLSPKLLQEVLFFYQTAKPINDFLKQALLAD